MGSWRLLHYYTCNFCICLIFFTKKITSLPFLQWFCITLRLNATFDLARAYTPLRFQLLSLSLHSSHRPLLLSISLTCQAHSHFWHCTSFFPQACAYSWFPHFLWIFTKSPCLREGFSNQPTYIFLLTNLHSYPVLCFPPHCTDTT